MISNSPPRLIEKLLLHLLPARDRESISGDLLEEYREEQLPRHGLLRANLWYLRQAVSFMDVRKILIPFCVFGMIAGIWLGVMENILKHDGYAGRTVIAACIALQALITLLPIERLRIVVMLAPSASSGWDILRFQRCCMAPILKALS